MSETQKPETPASVLNIEEWVANAQQNLDDLVANIQGNLARLAFIAIDSPEDYKRVATLYLMNLDAMLAYLIGGLNQDRQQGKEGQLIKDVEAAVRTTRLIMEMQDFARQCGGDLGGLILHEIHVMDAWVQAWVSRAINQNFALQQRVAQQAQDQQPEAPLEDQAPSAANAQASPQRPTEEGNTNQPSLVFGIPKNPTVH